MGIVVRTKRSSDEVVKRPYATLKVGVKKNWSTLGSINNYIYRHT